MLPAIQWRREILQTRYTLQHNTTRIMEIWFSKWHFPLQLLYFTYNYHAFFNINLKYCMKCRSNINCQTVRNLLSNYLITKQYNANLCLTLTLISWSKRTFVDFKFRWIKCSVWLCRKFIAEAVYKFQAYNNIKCLYSKSKNSWKYK